jgi:hypothetical protein
MFILAWMRNYYYELSRKGNQQEASKEKEKGGSSQKTYFHKDNWGLQTQVDIIPRVILSDPALQAHRDHMTEHAIICKFMGIWPTERALHVWIRSHWKPKGEINLHLGSKGFFTVVFTSLEDKDRVFEGGPYFYAAAGLYMRPWMMNFVPERETFTSVPVWIRLYSLPLDYWLPESLKTIGNKLGAFSKDLRCNSERKIHLLRPNMCGNGLIWSTSGSNNFRSI